MNQSQRLTWVDLMKGMLIFLVIFGHSLQGIVGKLNLHSGSIFNGMQVCYSFHMAAFFFVGGFFVSSWVKRFPKIAIAQKIRRLVVPYFIWSFITAIAMQIASGATTNGLGIREFLLSPFIPFSEYWFLYVMFIIFMIYYAVVHNFNRGGQIALLIISIILFLVQIFLPDIWILNKIGKFLIFFMLGTYFLQFRNIVINVINKKYLMLVTIIIFIALNCMNIVIIKSGNMYYVKGFYLLTALCGTVLVMELSLFMDKWTPNIFTNFIAYLGKNSMQFYVMHLVFLAGLRIIFLKIFGISHLWIIAIVITIFSIILCSLVLWISRKLRIDTLLF